MKARITVEVPDEFLTARVAELDRDAAADGIAGYNGDTAEFLRERLTDVADDELRCALFQWPLTATVEIEQP